MCWPSSSLLSLAQAGNIPLATQTPIDKSSDVSPSRNVASSTKESIINEGLAIQSQDTSKPLDPSFLIAGKLLDVANTILQDNKRQLEHVQNSIQVAAGILGLILTGFGFYGLKNLRDQRNDLTNMVENSRRDMTLLFQETKSNLEKTVSSISDDRNMLWAHQERSLRLFEQNSDILHKQVEASAEDVKARLDKSESELREKLTSLTLLQQSLEEQKKQLVNAFISFNILQSVQDYISEATRLGLNNMDADALVALRRAEKRIRKITEEIRPEDSTIMRNAYAYLAYLEKRLVSPQKALSTLENQVLDKDQDGQLYYNAACYACLSGDTEKWQLYLRKAVDKDPHFGKEALNDNDFTNVVNSPDFKKAIT